MNAEIMEINQSYSLDNGELLQFLVLRLPDGVLCKASVDVATAEHVMSLSSGKPMESAVASTIEQSPVEEPAIVDEEGAEVFGGEEVEPPKDLIDWQKLPSDQLSPLMKKVLLQIDVPTLLPAAQLAELVATIVDSMGQQQQSQTQQPAPMRTVPKNAAGYPIVSQSNTIDPGELVGGDDADEDGVGSI